MERALTRSSTYPCSGRTGRVLAATCLAVGAAVTPLAGQEPVRWGGSLEFATFSIAAVDPATGESGVAVTTRVPCVGNAVPHVRAGVGALATQATTRVEYGPEVLDLMARGSAPDAALRQRVEADSLRARRQVGVVALDGRTAQHTGGEANAWAGHRSGRNYATQGNLLVGPAVLEAVAASFEATEGSGRHLADRLIEALAAGQAAGGDARKGRLQSAAVIVADPRPGRSRRPDQVTADINVCEHPEPVGELRRIHDTISESLGYRVLQQHAGADVVQLKLLLHALGHYRAGEAELRIGSSSYAYDDEAVAAVDAFRAAEGLAGPNLGTPAGLVDAETLARLWAAVERAGKAEELRRRIRELTAIRR
jgi:uncharacterized Ntn-hydrolase superfamily protein